DRSAPARDPGQAGGRRAADRDRDVDPALHRLRHLDLGVLSRADLGRVRRAQAGLARQDRRDAGHPARRLTMGGAVPGWAPDDARLRDAARRPIPEIIREVFTVYGQHLEPLLVLAVVIEGSLALISLPSIVLTVRIMLAAIDAMGEVLRAPTSAHSFEAMGDVFRQFSDPA